MFKKVLSIVIAVLLIAGALSVTVFADEEPPVTEIRTVEDLYMINLDLAGNYKLMNDIDLTEATAEGGDWDFGSRGWEPIGSNGIYSGETPFTGTFDGNGHEIKGLRIDVKTLPSGTGESFVGLFSKNSGIIKNLTMSGNINASANVYYVGAIAGINYGNIENITVIGSINASANVYYEGAIAGINYGTIKACANKADITAKSTTHNNYVYAGGIAGYSGGKGTITQCYNTGIIKSTSSFFDYLACASGIAYNDATIDDCYNTGKIIASNTNYSSDRRYAGISASNNGNISNCYNTGTAERAISYGAVTNCYFLSGSGEDTTGAKSLTAAQMKLQAMYKGFDFENTWFIDPTGEYPYPQLINNAAYPPVQPTEPETDAPTEPETDAPTEAETAEPTVAPKVYYLGDVDGDGDATVVDATYIQRYATHIYTPYPVGELIPMD